MKMIVRRSLVTIISVYGKSYIIIRTTNNASA